MPVLRLCSEARLQVLRSWCRQQAKHIPFDGQKGSGALRILPGWPPNWLWGSWCTALNGSKRHVHRRLQARVTRSPQKLAHYQTVSYLGRNGYETGTKRVRNGMRGPFLSVAIASRCQCALFICLQLGWNIATPDFWRSFDPRSVRASSLQW